jgi:hypothetical protein
MKIERITSYNLYRQAADDTWRADRNARKQAKKESVQNQLRLPRLRRVASCCDTTPAPNL